MSESELLYLIQDTRDCVGNCASWWRPNSQGYTCNVDEAGRYSEAEALSITAGRNTDTAFPEHEVLKDAVRHVRVDTNHGKYNLYRRKTTKPEVKP